MRVNALAAKLLPGLRRSGLTGAGPARCHHRIVSRIYKTRANQCVFVVEQCPRIHAERHGKDLASVNRLVPGGGEEVLRSNGIGAARIGFDVRRQVGKGATTGPLDHSETIEVDQVRRHAARHAEQKARRIARRITHRRRADDHTILRIPAFELVQRRPHRIERVRRQPVVQFHDAGTIHVRLGRRIQQPRRHQCDDDQRHPREPDLLDAQPSHHQTDPASTSALPHVRFTPSSPEAKKWIRLVST